MPQHLIPTDSAEYQLDRSTRRALVNLAAGPDGDARSKHLLGLEIDQMKRTIAGPNPSPTESMLAESITLDHFFCRWSEFQFASEHAVNVAPTAAREMHMLKRIESARRRLNASIKTLATVRRLLGPGVVVSVATQVNVAGPKPSAADGRDPITLDPARPALEGSR